MKLIFRLLVVSFAFTLGFALPDASAAWTNRPPVQATNVVKKVKTVQPTNAATGSINIVAQDPPKEDLEPKPPGDKFTNSVDMELIKLGNMWVGKFDVTQKQYTAVMGSNPSAFAGGNFPVDSISYADAMDFCQKMTEMDLKKKKLLKGYYYTLPSEGEWAAFMADAPLTTAVTSLGTTRSGTSPVGSLAPNSLGLYDTRGNVAEFVLADDSKAYRVLKGGSWHDFVEVNLRPDFRWYCQPDEKQNTFGFRCVLKKK